jgi:DNA polymerase IV (DinB-like DNA polymerase)
VASPVIPRVIIGVDLDYFYAQCEEVRNPSIRGKPVVICVYSGRTEESGAVSTSNYPARKLGVKSGIPIILAKRILANYPESVFLPIDLDYYRIVSDRIMEMIRPIGDKFEQASVDEAYLDVSLKSHGSFDGALDIASRIKQEILANEKMTCSVGIGQNKLMAKMAVDSKKPNGLTVIPPGQESLFLSQLPLGRLYGIGPKTEDKLRSIGISTIGELALADRENLSDLFGKKQGPMLKEMANGVDESLVVERPIEQMSRIVTLKHDALIYDFSEVLKPISIDLAEKLASSHLMCKSVSIIAITSDLKIRSRSKSLGEATKSADQIYTVAGELFSSFFKVQGDPKQNEPRLRRVGIKISDFVSVPPAKTETLEDFI